MLNRPTRRAWRLLLMLLFVRNLQCDRNTIHKNLVFCLSIAEFIFLVGIIQYDKPVRHDDDCGGLVVMMMPLWWHSNDECVFTLLRPFFLITPILFSLILLPHVSKQSALYAVRSSVHNGSSRFLPRDAMLARYMLWPRVCHKSEFYQRLNVGSRNQRQLRDWLPKISAKFQLGHPSQACEIGLQVGYIGWNRRFSTRVCRVFNVSCGKRRLSLRLSRP